MEKLNLNQIHEEELKMLKKTVKFLDKNNINYSLAGGTLLGAVRHKGFIPWDDDIDIFIPRPDYERLQKLAKNEKISDELYICSNELHNSNYPFTKVINKNIIIFNETIKDKWDKYLWIDIFPIDGLPQDDLKIEKIYKRNFFRGKLLGIRRAKYCYLLRNNSIIKKVKILLIKTILYIFPPIFYTNLIQKNAMKYKYEDSKFAGVIVWGYGPQEKMKKEDFSNLINIEFENEKFKAIRNYDTYLTNLYNNYMKLPPIEEQKTRHEVEVYYKGENDEEIN